MNLGNMARQTFSTGSGAHCCHNGGLGTDPRARPARFADLFRTDLSFAINAGRRGCATQYSWSKRAQETTRRVRRRRPPLVDCKSTHPLTLTGAECTGAFPSTHELTHVHSDIHAHARSRSHAGTLYVHTRPLSHVRSLPSSPSPGASGILLAFTLSCSFASILLCKSHPFETLVNYIIPACSTLHKSRFCSCELTSLFLNFRKSKVQNTLVTFHNCSEQRAWSTWRVQIRSHLLCIAPFHWQAAVVRPDCTPHLPSIHSAPAPNAMRSTSAPSSFGMHAHL